MGEPSCAPARRPRMLFILMAAACDVVTAIATMPKGFLQRCSANDAAAQHEHRLVIMDVGANVGFFSLQVAQQCSAALSARGRVGSRAPRLELYLFEPNPMIAGPLADVRRQVSNLVPPWNMTVVTSAVWTVANELRTFHVSNMSIASSLHSANLLGRMRHTSEARAINVTTIDLADHLRATVFGKDVAFMKLDIECVEWAVVPHLLAARALCRLRFVRIEWHFKAACPGRNVSAFKNFAAQLEHSCRPATANTMAHGAPLYDYEVDSQISFHAALRSSDKFAVPLSI